MCNQRKVYGVPTLNSLAILLFLCCRSPTHEIHAPGRCTLPTVMAKPRCAASFGASTLVCERNTPSLCLQGFVENHIGSAELQVAAGAACRYPSGMEGFPTSASPTSPPTQSTTTPFVSTANSPSTTVSQSVTLSSTQSTTTPVVSTTQSPSTTAPQPDGEWHCRLTTSNKKYKLKHCDCSSGSIADWRCCKPTAGARCVLRYFVDVVCGEGPALTMALFCRCRVLPIQGSTFR